MNSKFTLLMRVIVIGLIIASLGYLFHPDVGQLTVLINGKPVVEPFVQIAAIPTFLLILGLTVFLAIMLFFGLSLLVFIVSLIFVAMLSIFIAPYLWPVLVILFIIITLMSFTHNEKT